MDGVECAVFRVQGKALRRAMAIPFQGVVQRSHVPQKLHNLPHSELTIQVNVEYRENLRGSWF
ncbi:MAG: hypothetical protein BGO99_02960 [Nitrosospira sp. 56-18]|nr:MAG: hypothetical protein BGO99_02960 [Nitrosospira sp. 56-18]